MLHSATNVTIVVPSVAFGIHQLQVTVKGLNKEDIYLV